MVASVKIARLLFVAGKIPPEQRNKTRQDLLDYCERDTEAMVELLKSLRKLAGSFMSALPLTPRKTRMRSSGCDTETALLTCLGDSC